jgi:hypothetical protein
MRLAASNLVAEFFRARFQHVGCTVQGIGGGSQKCSLGTPESYEFK